MIEFGGSATIPTGQYRNVQPVFTVQAETLEEARALWLKEMRITHEMLGQTLELRDEEAVKPAPAGQILRCRVSGTEVIFDPVAHTYHDRQGNRYTGGSTFASRYKEPFPANAIAKKMADKAGDVSADEILAMWKLNAEASTSFGTGVHAALQLYGEYVELSKRVKAGSDEAALTKNPTLQPMVLKFFTDARKAETAYYEEFVANEAELACGLIDRLVVEPDGLIIEDYKTNADVNKPEKVLPPFADRVPNSALGVYFIQMAYYARVLQSHGRTVKEVRVHHWDGSEWVTYPHPVVDLSEVFSV